MNSIAVQGIQDHSKFQNAPSFEKGGLGRIKNFLISNQYLTNQ